MGKTKFNIETAEAEGKVPEQKKVKPVEVKPEICPKCGKEYTETSAFGFCSGLCHAES